jgi:hypothetical protein
MILMRFCKFLPCKVEDLARFDAALAGLADSGNSIEGGRIHKDCPLGIYYRVPELHLYGTSSFSQSSGRDNSAGCTEH